MLVNDEAIKEVARQSSVLDATASSHWDGKKAKGRKYDLAEDPLNFSKFYQELRWLHQELG